MTQLVIQHYARPTARRHLWVGMAMAVVAIAFGIEQAVHWLAAHPMAAKGLEASLLAGAATGLGAIPVLMLRRPSERLMAPMLGLAGGMMLAASLFSLLVPAVQTVMASDAVWSLGMATAGALLAGIAAMQMLDRRLPHEHVEEIESSGMQPNVALVVAAIAIHNVPEGLAVGVAAAAGADHGMSLGIALQNIPEGWIVASAMVALGAAPLRATLIALGTGLVEPVGGLFGVIASTVAGAALPMALAAAAGAMLWVVSHEMIPASHKPGRVGAGTAGLATGFAVMTVLAAAF
ncbi:ZIP family metal transporter [Ferribacterium limneticum]|uniref:ZIP family metal transporter n=1 Tax=Ferribacterium limneticum TaxID=76259 RepID=UPI001CFAD10C|nr:ZIP family metal transporter [Ferribacterium limneticum]UCV18489.1 ZIP family metal transporter [Ferribacterium limneticum]